LADYTNSKGAPGAAYPAHSVDAQAFSRVEPLITPDQLRRRQLLGIPLVSFFPNPITGVRDEITNDDLKDMILRSVSEAELMTGIDIFPIQKYDKYPFERTFFQDFGYIQVVSRPIVSVESLAFTSANGNDLFQLNPDWIEPANFSKGQINITPFVPVAAVQFVPSTSIGLGSAYLTFLNGLSWIPAIVKVQYTTGFPNGQMPRVINELIGCIAAIEALSALGATNRASSYSLGIDSMNQSVSSPGPMLYQPRIDGLAEKRDELVKKIKNVYGLGVTSGWI
jgi:hypothetical protein